MYAPFLLFCDNGIGFYFCYVMDIAFKYKKGIWWMPWHMEAMKDVLGCDKPRRGAKTLWPWDFRMGEPPFLRDPALNI